MLPYANAYAQQFMQPQGTAMRPVPGFNGGMPPGFTGGQPPVQPIAPIQAPVQGWNGGQWGGQPPQAPMPINPIQSPVQGWNGLPQQQQFPNSILQRMRGGM
jgi:hypothetical protein